MNAPGSAFAVYDSAAKQIVAGNIFDNEREASDYITRLGWSRPEGHNPSDLHVIKVPTA